LVNQTQPMHPVNPHCSVAIRPDVSYFSILICLTPDDFTRQGKRATTQWVNLPTQRCDVPDDDRIVSHFEVLGHGLSLRLHGSAAVQRKQYNI
jgi:hypothetical protein